MKTLKRSALFTMVLALMAVSPVQAVEVEVTGQYAVAMGDKAQNFNSNLGVGLAVYLDRFIDPSIANYISVGYNSFGLKTDQSTAFRVFPITIGIDLEGKVFKDLLTTFGVGIGGAFGYLSVQNQSSYNMNGYFVGQVKPGFEYLFGDGFSLVGKMPITFLAGKGSLTYSIYEAGLKFKF